MTLVLRKALLNAESRVLREAQAPLPTYFPFKLRSSRPARLSSSNAFCVSRTRRAAQGREAALRVACSHERVVERGRATGALTGIISCRYRSLPCCHEGPAALWGLCTLGCPPPAHKPGGSGHSLTRGCCAMA